MAVKGKAGAAAGGAYRRSARRAADVVVAALENKIYTGEFKIGCRMPAERELTEEFGISRTVAREAIKILRGKGLIDSRPGFRPVVRRPGYDSALDALSGMARQLLGTADGNRNLYEMRLFAEAALARLAATDANKEHIAGLREALKNNGACIRHSELFYETDMAFHAVLYTIPGNPIFPALHRAFNKWMAGHWRQMAHLPARNERNHRAHSDIFEAILNRNPDDAESLMRQHLQEAWEQVEHTFFSPDKKDGAGDGDKPVGKKPAGKTSGKKPTGKTSGRKPAGKTSGKKPVGKTSGKKPVGKTSGKKKPVKKSVKKAARKK